MRLSGIHKHAIASISNKITFLCDLYLSMSSLTMWVFDLSSSLDFLSLLFLTNYSRLYQKRYIVGTSIIENFFQCCFMIDDKKVKESRFACSWFAVWAWWMLSFSYFQKMWIALTLYLIWRVFPKDVDSINVRFNVKGIANIDSCDKSEWSTKEQLY